MEQLPYNEDWDEVIREMWTCPECDGWGFQIVFESQWEESNDSPAPCLHCAGLGYVEGC